VQLLVLNIYTYFNVDSPGQEEGNVPYVENSGFGSYSGNPNTIAETVSTWLSSPEMLQTMQAAALAAARPTATIDIAKDLAVMLFEYKSQQVANDVEDKVVIAQ